MIDIRARRLGLIDPEMVVVRRVQNCFFFFAGSVPSTIASTLRELNGRTELTTCAFKFTFTGIGLKSRDCAA